MMNRIKRALGIKTDEEIQQEVNAEPHVAEARRVLDNFYASVQSAENRAVGASVPVRRRRHR